MQIISVSFGEIFERAKLWMSNGDFNKARELLIKTNKVKETATAYKLIGMTYIKQKKYNQAFNNCSKAYQLNQTDAENLVNLFNLNIMRADFNGASKMLNELRFMNIESEKIERLEAFLNKKKTEFESRNN